MKWQCKNIKFGKLIKEEFKNLSHHQVIQNWETLVKVKKSYLVHLAQWFMIAIEILKVKKLTIIMMVQMAVLTAKMKTIKILVLIWFMARNHYWNIIWNQIKFKDSKSFYQVHEHWKIAHNIK